MDCWKDPSFFLFVTVYFYRKPRGKINIFASVNYENNLGNGSLIFYRQGLHWQPPHFNNTLLNHQYNLVNGWEGMSHTSIQKGGTFKYWNFVLSFQLLCFCRVLWAKEENRCERSEKNDFLTALLISRVQRQCSKVGFIAVSLLLLGRQVI